MSQQHRKGKEEGTKTESIGFNFEIKREIISMTGTKRKCASFHCLGVLHQFHMYAHIQLDTGGSESPGKRPAFTHRYSQVAP